MGARRKSGNGTTTRKSSLTTHRYCKDSEGSEVLVREEQIEHVHESESEEGGHNHSHEESGGEAATHCHFHAGVE